MTAPGPAADRFARELGQAPPELRSPELLGVLLSRACAAALPVDGAGISIHARGGLRTPLGASDPTAAQAERLQFTQGVGPCLQAHDDGVVIAFDETDIARNWPSLHEALTTTTPFRAVLSVPLLPPLGPLVVLDLYARDPGTLPAVDRAEVADVVTAVTRELAAAARSTADTEPDPGRGWWEGPDALRRARVWQAMGMVNVAHGMDGEDALAMLKAHAFAQGRVVDDVAEDLVSGRLPLDALRGPADGQS
ncbi:ANTAR domain-containing protein [Modestobacter sp. SYSU DS0290]